MHSVEREARSLGNCCGWISAGRMLQAGVIVELLSKVRGLFGSTSDLRSSDLSWYATLNSHSRTDGVAPALILFLGLAALIALFWQTVSSATELWYTSSVYTYGYLIIPVAVYFVWSERRALARMVAAPSITGVAIVFAFALVWLLADFLRIDEGRHIAFVGMTQGLFLGVLGPAIYRKLVFPLSYLWLMVPAGEFLYGPLQSISHAGAVVMLQASGIAVYAEGILIQVPQGNFLVEPGCAGLNFLLTALALSLVYGKLMYRRIATRVLCVLVALAASIVANCVRIYLIIALTEWTDQRIGLADDHLLFGWGFFAIAMFALMWFGARLSRSDVADENEVVTGDSVLPRSSAGYAAIVMTTAVLVAAAAPVLSSATTGPGAVAVDEFVFPPQLGPWHMEPFARSEWQPRIVPGDVETRATYSRDGAQVDVLIVLHQTPSQGLNAADAGGPVGGAEWTTIEARKRTMRLSGNEIVGVFSTLESNAGLRAVMYWYQSGACAVPNLLYAKICDARERFRGRGISSAFIGLSTDQGGDREAAELSLLDIAWRIPSPIPTSPAAGRIKKE